MTPCIWCNEPAAGGVVGVWLPKRKSDIRRLRPNLPEGVTLAVRYRVCGLCVLAHAPEEICDHAEQSALAELGTH
jgi:hypothetical protein